MEKTEVVNNETYLLPSAILTNETNAEAVE